MNNDEIRNARIVGTFLGMEDHGFFVLTLTLDYGNAQQGYQRILGTSYTDQFLRSVLATVGVESYEQLRGKAVRARIAGGLIVQLGNILTNTWTADTPVEGSQEE